jgi:hypothetical protein
MKEKMRTVLLLLILIGLIAYIVWSGHQAAHNLSG